MTAHEQEYLEQLATAVADKVIAALPDRDTRPMLTLDQVAARLGISERSVRDMVNSARPKLASMKVGPSEGSRVVEQAELDRYIETRRLASRTVIGEDQASSEA